MNKLNRLLMALTVALLLTACGPNPPPTLPPEPGGIRFSGPAPCKLPASKDVSVSYEGGYSATSQFKWEATEGAFSPSDIRNTRYNPGSVLTDTEVIISVLVITNDQVTPYDARCTVIADVSATPSPTQEATNTPMPEPSVVAATPPTVIACPSTSFAVVMDRQQLWGIVRDDSVPLSFVGENGYTGFEVELLREIARRWFGSPDSFKPNPVLPKDRIPELDGCDWDVIAAALTDTTLTTGKDRGVDFSNIYVRSGPRLLVRANSTIESVCDLNGLKIGLTEGTTGLDNFERRALECKPLIVTAERPTYDNPATAVNLLLTGQIDAFTTDNVLLEHWIRKYPGQLKIVGNEFADEPYGIATRDPKKHPGEDGRLLALVNATLHEMKQDGTFAALFCQWFPGEQPYPLDTAATSDPELLALALAETPYEGIGDCDPTGDFPKYHTVEAGDFLSKLAQQYYGNASPKYWEPIYQYEDNSEKIGDNPDKLPIGITITIPAPPKDLPANYLLNPTPTPGS